VLIAERERESVCIFHIAKTLEQVHNRNAKLGGLPERHLAHQSWPPSIRESFFSVIECLIYGTIDQFLQILVVSVNLVDH